MVFGHLDDMLPSSTSAPTVSDNKREVWESWKQKLGGLTAKAIDVLMLHGPMNQAQLRIQLACAQRSVTNVIAALNKAALINKVDGKISLKEL
jgi:DNA-binding MarR family transcriptional regulator